MTATASAPSSSGNLGPGFDTLALALDLRCTVTADVAPSLTVDEGTGVRSLDEGDLIARAVLAAAGRPMHLTIRNDVPRSRGLGSSAAVSAAAAAAAMVAVDGNSDRNRVFDIVRELEGHGDNAAAAVYGGLVSVSGPEVNRLEVHPSLVQLVAVPSMRLPTSSARAALDPAVPREAVVRSLARVLALVEGLRRGDAELLAQAGGDELHEEPRAVLSPVSAELMSAARSAGAFHAAWSGAGPSVIAFCDEVFRPRVFAAMDAVLNSDGRVLDLAVDREGLR